MTRARKIKLTVSCIILVLAVWAAIPQVYSYAFFGQKPGDYEINAGSVVRSQPPDDSEFGNKPAYFSIFRFISRFIPAKPQNAFPSEAQIISSFFR